MTVNAHIFPSFNLAINGSNVVIGTTGALVALIGAGSFYLGGTAGISNSTVEGLTTWTSIKAGGTGGALTEVANGSGYTTNGLAITGSTIAIADSGAATPWTTITCSATLQWTAATFTAYQCVFYFNGAATAGICYWDFGGAQSCSSGTFTLTLGTANSVANALVQYTAN